MQPLSIAEIHDQGTTYTVYDQHNNRAETFAGPCRLAEWCRRGLPAGWIIEEFSPFCRTVGTRIEPEEVIRRADAIAPRGRAADLGGDLWAHVFATLDAEPHCDGR